MVFSLIRRLFGMPSVVPAPRNEAAWLTALGGYLGPKSVSMKIYRIGEPLPACPGVFLFAGVNQRHWQAVFVGETADIRSRASGHEALPEALILGATHAHVIQMDDASLRQSTAERLIFMYGPPLNAAGAPTLSELIAAGKVTTPPPQPRLAVAS